jgi:hypothetical protein
MSNTTNSLEFRKYTLTKLTLANENNGDHLLLLANRYKTTSKEQSLQLYTGWNTGAQWDRGIGYTEFIQNLDRAVTLRFWRKNHATIRSYNKTNLRAINSSITHKEYHCQQNSLTISGCMIDCLLCCTNKRTKFSTKYHPKMWFINHLLQNEYRYSKLILVVSCYNYEILM